MVCTDEALMRALSFTLTLFLVAACGDDDVVPADSGPLPMDAGGFDAGGFDAAVDDAGMDDAGMDDAGPGDAGMDDASMDDAGPGDAGMDDAGMDDAGIDDGGAGDAGPGDAGPPDGGIVMAFDCASLPAPVGDRVCDDFNGAFDELWTTPQGGRWTMTMDGYRAIGTVGAPTPCGASLLAASLVSGFSAADVRITASLNPQIRDDAAIILRAADESNRIELNFRAGHPDGVSYLADLVVQELSGCTQTLLTDPGIPAEHVFLPGNPRRGDTFEVVVELVGSRLIVEVDGMLVLDDMFAFANTAAGGVGVGVIAAPTVGDAAGVTHFDYFIAEAL
jgi:hypothetical protein